MKKFSVKLNEKHHATSDQIVNGYLGNMFGNGRIAIYDRGTALKKANMFGGRIEEAKGLHTVIDDLSIQTIPENALLHLIVNELRGREVFKDADTTNDERMYHGNVFMTILEEQEQIQGSPMCLPKKVLNQLVELMELITADYVLITLS